VALTLVGYRQAWSQWYSRGRKSVRGRVTADGHSGNGSSCSPSMPGSGDVPQALLEALWEAIDSLHLPRSEPPRSLSTQKAYLSASPCQGGVVSTAFDGEQLQPLSQGSVAEITQAASRGGRGL
jgi:hypothetical protein